MKFHLEIEMDNDAFKPYFSNELCKILMNVSTAVHMASDSQLVDQSFKVRDVNGNTVGRYWVEGNEDE